MSFGSKFKIVTCYMRWSLALLVMLFYLCIMPAIFVLKQQQGTNFNARHYCPPHLLEDSSVKTVFAANAIQKLSPKELLVQGRYFKIVAEEKTENGTFYVCLENKSKSLILALPLHLDDLNNHHLAFLSLAHFDVMFCEMPTCQNRVRLLTAGFRALEGDFISKTTDVFHPPQV